MRETKKSNRTKMAAVIAILLVCVLAIGGTIAYLTTHSTLDNKFTVGDISPIDPTDPDLPDPDPEGPDPIDPNNPDPTRLNGNLYEPNWIEDSKLMPGVSISKDPYVGAGAGSEPCDVYVRVDNLMDNANNSIYFAINEGWEAVEREAQTVTIEGTVYYTGGIFKYTKGLDASELEKPANAWTETPLFTDVEVSEGADVEDFAGEYKTINVQAFLHQSYDANGDKIDDDTILTAAKEAFAKNGK